MKDTTLVGIFGSGRNGSTLIARLLDGIPGAYMHPVEANFLSAFNDLALSPIVRRGTIQNAVTHPLRRLSRRVKTKRLLGFYGSHFPEIESEYLSELEPGTIQFARPAPERLADREAYTAAEFVPEFLAATAAWLGQGTAQYLFFKTIETPYVADYEDLFPNMKFIHILRDPVDTWASQKRSLVNNKQLPPWYLGGDNFRATIECRWMPHAEAVLVRRQDPRHFVLRYEDLVRDAAGKIGEICAWLNVPVPPDPDTQTLLGGHHPRKVHNNPSQKGVETPRQAVADLHKRFAFDPVVSPRERDFILLRTARFAHLLGYGSPETTPNSAHVRRLWLGTDEWDFKYTSGLHSRLRALRCFVVRRLYIWRHTANAS
jgi:hypothetical protein